MTRDEVIADARSMLQDKGTTLRWSDLELIGYLDAGLQKICVARPTLFQSAVELTLTADTSLQELPAQYRQLVEILDDDGLPVRRIDIQALRQTRPTSAALTGSVIAGFQADPRDDRRFWVYPVPASNLTVNALVTTEPEAAPGTGNIPKLPKVYAPALAYYIAYRTLITEDEAADQERAKLMKDGFFEVLQLDQQTKSALEPL